MPDVHPQDLAMLKLVQADLTNAIKVARSNGVTNDMFAERHGHSPDFVRRSLKADPAEWHWATLFGLACAVPARPVIHFLNLPDVSTPMWRIGQNSPALLGIGMMDMLAEMRRKLDVPYRQVGVLLGTVKSNVPKLEDADNPKLVSAMRYARALGGQVVYTIEV